MKKWENAELAELSLQDTENGGRPSTDFDQQWFDQNGALHVNFVAEESKQRS